MVNKSNSTSKRSLVLSALDGSHDGVRYFETDANHGLFCRADKVKHLSINGAPQRNSIQIPSRLSTIGINKLDTF
jgi:dynactin complex subunit